MIFFFSLLFFQGSPSDIILSHYFCMCESITVSSSEIPSFLEHADVLKGQLLLTIFPLEVVE